MEMNISIVRRIKILALLKVICAQTSHSGDVVPTVKLADVPTDLVDPEIPTVTLPEPPTASVAATALNETTSVPSFSPTPPPNACSSLKPGDVNVIIFNSDPVDQIVFFTLNDIPASVGSLFVTDRAWDGQKFATNEGTLEYFIPTEGIKAGSTFGYGILFPGQNGEWSESDEESAFDLSTVGPDSILLYCMNAIDEPRFLSALTYNDDGFADAGKLSYSTGETALPETLVDTGSLSLPFAPNYIYKGPLEGKRDTLLVAFSDPSNFQGSLVPFEIETKASQATVSTNYFGFCLLVAAML